MAGLVVALLLAAAVRWTEPERVADLRPRPDALEYEEGARNLASGRGYVLMLGADAVPPRYPPGFSALLAPVVGAFPGRPGVGVWVVLATALIAIAGTWRLGLAAGGPAVAAAAALLIALSPLHARWSRAVMSDVPATACIAWLGVAVLGCLRGPARSGWWLGLGVAAGLASAVRVSALDVVPAALVLLAVDRRLAGSERARRAVALAGGVAVGLLPQLVGNALRFGSPLATGYDYWEGASFGTAYVFGPAFGGETGNLPYYLGLLGGAGRLYPWPIALLVAAGLVRLVRQEGEPRRVAVLALGVTAIVLARQLPFFWQSERFLLPALPFLCAAWAAPFAATAPRVLRATAAALAALALVALARTPAPFAPPDPEMFDANALAAIDRIAEPNAAILARTSPMLFERVVRRRGDRLWVPLGLDEHRTKMARFGRAPLWSDPAGAAWMRETVQPPLSGERLRAAVEPLLAEGRPVYLSTQLFSEAAFLRHVRPLLEADYSLEPVAAVGSAEILRLRNRAAVQ
jgi:hypothetical protein